MNYVEFKTFLTDTLWRQNDIDLSNNIDTYITLAENELNRTLTIQQREVGVLIAPATEDYVLPTDFRQVMSLANMQPERQMGDGPMMNTTMSNIMKTRADSGSTAIAPLYYAQRASAGNTLYLSGPFSADGVGSLMLQYRSGIPDFATDDTSWLADDYLDLYMYTVFKHVAVFLREDERLQTYAAYAQSALEGILDEDLRQVRFGGSPLKMQNARQAPVTRHR